MAEIPLSRLLQRQAASDRLAASGGLRRAAAPTARRIAQRRRLVGVAKWSLPALALVLLGSIAAWPEIMRVTDHGRVTFRRAFQLEPESGRMGQPQYRGLDERGRPYTVTATSAQQTSIERIALVEPKGDLVTESGTWLMVQARQGVFIQHLSLMDLSQDVTLYREDGTVMQTDAAAMDMKAGVATSSDKTHAEGPFGTLDAQGFTLVDKGAVIQFQGASHAVLNAAQKTPEEVRPGQAVTGQTATRQTATRQTGAGQTGAGQTGAGQTGAEKARAGQAKLGQGRAELAK